MAGYKYQEQIGGFLLWVLIKFCKTKLEDEQLIVNRVEIFFLIVIGVLVTFMSIRFF